MARKSISLITNETYHIYNRGVDKRKIFSDKLDYFRFHKSLQLFNSKKQSGSVYELSFHENWIDTQDPIVRIHAYCLLSNHFHLLVTQLVDGGISEFMKRLGGGYTLYFNERHGRSGSLFQGRYKRAHCESNEQLIYTAAYVNLNNEVHNRSDYSLSSYETYTGKRDETFVYTNLILKQYKNKKDFIKSTLELVNEIAAKRKIDRESDISILLE